MRRSLTIALTISAFALLSATFAPTCLAGRAVIRVSPSSDIGRAVRLAEAKGAGTTVYFTAGSYSHSALTWPKGINLRGDGIGKTKLNFGMRFGSGSIVGGRYESMGLTIGSTHSTSAFSLRSGAHGTRFRWVRFRSRGPVLWDMCDFTHHWRDRVSRDTANAHDIAWTDCEFEYTGDGSGTTFNIWWDARAGGGNIYNMTWRRCTFGVKDSTGHYGSGRTGMLIQPSPPEHASDGPRPEVATTNYSFDFSKVTHGSGQAAIGGAKGYGFRIWDSAFVGSASLASFDLCDYIRAWAMVRYRLSDPSKVTAAMRAAAPDRVTTKGVSLRSVWMSGDFCPEIGRNVERYRLSENQGSGTYHVRPIVLQHDRQLYGS